MACYIFDIDGTIVNYHTSHWLPGAKEYLTELAKKGNRIIFLTMRTDKRDKDTEWSEQKTVELLSELDFSYDILYDVPSPRTIYDDSKVEAIKKKQNTDWWDELEILQRG